MLFDSFREDEDVVQVYNDDAVGNELLEDVVHHGLKRRRTIGESEEHDEWFEQPAVSAKSGFPLVALLHADIVETPSDIQFREVLGSPELSDELWDERQWVFVLHSHGVEHAVSGLIYVLSKVHLNSPGIF